MKTIIIAVIVVAAIVVLAAIQHYRSPVSEIELRIVNISESAIEDLDKLEKSNKDLNVHLGSVLRYRSRDLEPGEISIIKRWRGELDAIRGRIRECKRKLRSVKPQFPFMRRMPVEESVSVLDKCLDIERGVIKDLDVVFEEVKEFHMKKGWWKPEVDKMSI